jgi:phosphomannomutase
MGSQNIFKSYDIRGIYPTELDKESAYNIGRAFIDYSSARKIIIGRDMRLSSPVLFKWLVKGIVSRGADVFSIGEAPIECVYFAVGRYDYQAGIMITASHNPKEYNGFKMVRKVGKKVEAVSGKDLVTAMEKVDSLKISKRTNKKDNQKGKKLTVKNIDIWSDYLEHIFSFIEVSRIKPFKVVVDAGNGLAGKVVPLLAPKLPIKIIPLNFNLNGNFPAHSSNPLAPGAADQVCRAVRKEKADFGFIFDGDADRVFLIDELGNFLPGDTTLLFLAEFFLKKEPGRGIAYNLICSRAVPEFIKKWGGRPLRTKVGFVNISRAMMENDGIMGGELSGHFSFRDNFYHDSGFIAFLVLLQVISDSGRKVSVLAKKLSPYIKSPEINFRIKNKNFILKEIKKKFAEGEQDYLDGLTVEYKNWWFNIRPSQTEPLLRLTIEAKSRKILEKKKKELVSLISQGGCF